MSEEKNLEQQIIASLLISPRKIEIAEELGLLEAHFFDERMKEVYKELIEKYNENNKVDTSSLRSLTFEEILLLTDNIYIVHIDEAIKNCINNYKKRTLDTEIKKIIVSEETTDEKKNKILSVIDKIENSVEKNKEFDIKYLLKNWWDRVGENQMQGVKTPFECLSNLVFFEKGSLITIGARPAMGKTAFGLNLSRLTAKKHNVLYVNLEMSESQIIDRMVSAESKVDLWKISKGLTDETEKKLIVSAVSQMEDLKLRVLDVEDNNFNLIINKIRRIQQKEKQELIVIDYLTLMQAKGHQSKNYEVEYMSNRLKLLAKELDTCIVILAQLNRGVESRADKKPMLSDLRDSGGIEQASNVVLLLHRADYYVEESSNVISDLQVIVAKNRSGSTGTITLGYNLKTQAIKEAVNEIRKYD